MTYDGDDIKTGLLSQRYKTNIAFIIDDIITIIRLYPCSIVNIIPKHISTLKQMKE